VFVPHGEEALAPSRTMRPQCELILRDAAKAAAPQDEDLASSPPKSNGGPRPAVLIDHTSGLGARAELRLHPGFEGYFLAFALAFFAFFAFFAFLAIASSFGLMDGNADTRHARRRASLATSSNVIRTDSQAKALLRHTDVMALSTADMRFRAFFAKFSRRNAVHDHFARATRLVRVNDAATPLARSAPFFRTRSAGVFMISKLRLRIAQIAVRVR
jgi:hypothetical protein